MTHPSDATRERQGTLLVWCLVVALLALVPLMALQDVTREDLTSIGVLKGVARARQRADAIRTAVQARTDGAPWDRRPWATTGQMSWTEETVPGEASAVTIRDRDIFREHYHLRVDVTCGRTSYRFGWAITRATTPLGDLPARPIQAGARLPSSGDPDIALDSIWKSFVSPPAGLSPALHDQILRVETDLGRDAATLSVNPVAPSSLSTPPAVLYGVP
jgi:hypothetical protein